MAIRAASRLFLMMTALCLLGARGLAVAQVANAPQRPIPGGGYRIAGTVVSKTDGHPLARARIVIRDAKNPKNFQFVITTEDGKFQFSGLPVGKYSLAGAKRGFIFATYDQHDQFSTAIVTGAGLDTENVLLKLAPNAVITGKVLDEAGEPVRHAMVDLYYDDHQTGVDQIYVSRSAQTDDLGTYELTPLMPGTYFLSAYAKPWYAVHPHSEPTSSKAEGDAAPAPVIDRSLDVAYPTTYYPDVTEADSATPIPIRGGERLEVDIHLNPVPALRLIFHVPGDGTNGYTFPQLEQAAFDASTNVQISGGRMLSPGVFEVTGVPAGRYNIRTRGAGPGMQMNDVDLSQDGAEIDASAGEALSSVKVSVEVPGEDPLPPRLAVGLRAGRRVIAGWEPVDSKGEAELKQVPAGRYEVVVIGGNKPYWVVHISAERAEVSGRTVTVAPAASPSVSLTLVAGTVQIQGTAKRAGKAFSGAMVVLVPKDPEGHSDLFRRDQSDLDGTFSLNGVIPGSYTILAIENGWDLDWSRPGVIAAYTQQGKTIEVGNQAGRPLNLADAVEVQAK